MYRVYKITDFKVGDHLFKFEDGVWIDHGKIVLEQGSVFGIREVKHEGIIMLRKDVLYSEGFIASKNQLDNSQKHWYNNTHNGEVKMKQDMIDALVAVGFTVAAVMLLHYCLN